MARPITPTPVLQGKDAERFFAKAEDVVARGLKMPDREYREAITNYEKFKRIAEGF